MLIDKTGLTVVEYTYDSWGKLLSTTGSLAETFGAEQHFRYRGYVYDEETGFYYLQSRYYNPELGRFISADVYLSTGQGVLGHNAYAYCLNNPTNMADSGGQYSSWQIISISLHDGDRAKGIDYIDDQTDPSIKDLPFGKKGTIGDNGCGLISLYNVLSAYGIEMDFEWFNDELSDCFGLHLFGGRL